MHTDKPHLNKALVVYYLYTRWQPFCWGGGAGGGGDFKILIVLSSHFHIRER